jgi:AcrR family transcriptional regulator
LTRSKVRSARQASARAPRGKATTEALRATVRELLDDLGYQALTIEGVAAHSGVAKTSIYRRWPSKAEMVLDLVLHSSDELPPMDDQGSLAGDIDALANRVVAVVAGPLGRHVFPGLIGDAAGDPALMERLRHTIVLEGRKEITDVLQRSVRRGELTDTDAVADLQAVLLGSVLMFVLFDPDIDMRLLRDKTADLAMAVLSTKRVAPRTDRLTRRARVTRRPKRA